VKGALAVALLAVVALLLPAAKDDFLLSLLTLVFIYGYFGSAWNIMMGLAGQLSLGHGLYVGLGAYTVAILSTRYGVTPWVTMAAAGALCAGAGAVIGMLGFRFAVRGVYFALLTIAFAEFARIAFDNWPFVGDTGGFFLPALDPAAAPLAALRGTTRFFYYETLVLLALGIALSAALIRSRLGYLWRAVRDDEDAARALGARAFALKVGAAAISAGMTGVGGGIFGLLNGSLFPDTLMGMGMSIQLILGPVIGGLGTVTGPVLGAGFVVLLNEMSTRLGNGLGVAGLNTLASGIVILLVIVFMPEGIWPALRRLAPKAVAPAAPRGEAIASEAIAGEDPT
jgi:branched-chain amino acid transport system permease protein